MGVEGFKKLALAVQQFKPVVANKVAVVKTKTGGSYQYNYADLADYIAATREALAAQGLFVSQRIIKEDLLLACYTTVLDESGTVIEGSAFVAMPMGGSAQDFGAAISYARRYSYAATLSIPVEEPFDGPPGEGQDGRGYGSPPPPSAQPPAKPEAPWRGSEYLRPARRALGENWRINPTELRELLAAATAAGLADPATQDKTKLVDLINRTVPDTYIDPAARTKARLLQWDRLSWRDYASIIEGLARSRDDVAEAMPSGSAAQPPEEPIFMDGEQVY